MNRPKLANLTAHKKREEEEKKRAFEIRLCSSEPAHSIKKEISVLLIAAIVLLDLSYVSLWQTMIRVVFILVWFKLSIEWVFTFAILLVIFAHDDAWSYKFVPFANALLIYFAERILNATQKAGKEQTAHQQEVVDKAIEDYTKQKRQSLVDTAEDISSVSSMIMDTLEQFAPPSVLSSTYELLSACSMAVPITTISAINTAVKQTRYIGSRLQALSDRLRDDKESTVHESFDVGEFVQNIGDALAGLSAKLDIHFIVYHMDNGLHYTHIMGDEAGTRHAIIHLLRDVFEGCTPGACIELGLNLVSLGESRVKVIFDILQTASPAIPAGLSSVLLIPNRQITQQLIHYIGGKLTTEETTEPNKARIQVVLETYLGKMGDQQLLLIEKPSQILEKQLENVQFSNEPTLKDLTTFIASLKGVRLVLHAAEKSIFAKHLTSSLTNWNADISHLPLASNYDTTTPRLPQRGQIPSSAAQEDHIHATPPAFILIDDDAFLLEKKLREFRDLQPRKKRPSNENILHQGTTLGVIYFTSLSNYKRVRDTIQWFSTQSFRYPRVVVVPKPAGPRRFLTALHTAWINAVVEPQFVPIATSPLSPFMTSPQTDSTSFVTPALMFTPRGFSPKRQSPEERGHYFTPRNNVTSPFKEKRHRSHSNVKTPPVFVKEEIKAKPKMNFNISNRKRKEKKVSSHSSPPITVLIVEDNRINQAILSTWMKKHGIKFSVASDGKEAVEKWRGGGFHLILMDIQLPVMDGIQATKTIRDLEREQKIGVLASNFQSPVIIVALTASSLESDRRSALAAGCNDFLTKPLSLEWLDKKIMEWGCMQALIDFEGWKKWRKKKSQIIEEKGNNEEKILVERTQILRDTNRGIILSGSSQSNKPIDSIPKQLEERDKDNE
ncbi:ssk1 response regulator receiver [Rhizopus stolonifer]|uniref:Ssk1 response regulator receiver n=1 Tax=Rhizopus stolonifer TaxID=4846 RepID=A0A367K4E0_RHIST|nr:ssk1 response regulator receiver [Rhizopus stolonifer]